jgi:hypothetical protein
LGFSGASFHKSAIWWLDKSLNEVGCRKNKEINMNLCHRLLSTTRILLVPFLHVFFAEDLISGRWALRLVSRRGFN